MNHWHDVCALSDIPPDSGVCALVEQQQIALFYLAKLQQVFAISNFDPIGKANVLSRGMVGDLGGEPMVASPLYKHHYSLRSGQCFEAADVVLATYPVRLEQQRVWVQVNPVGGE